MNWRRQTKAALKWVPKTYKIDDEFNCLTNSERLAKLNPDLRLAQGWTKFAGGNGRGAHQWCVAPNGAIVDPYFQWQFPDTWKNILYQEASGVFA